MESRNLSCWHQRRSWRCQSDEQKVPANRAMEESMFSNKRQRLGQRLGQRLETVTGKRNIISIILNICSTHVFLSQGGAFIMKSAVLMVIIGCHIVLGDRGKDMRMDKGGLIKTKGPSVFMSGEKATHPFVLPPEWSVQTPQAGRGKGALALEGSQFHGILRLKGMNGQVWWKGDIHGNSRLLLNVSIPQSRHRSQFRLQGVLYHNGYMQQVKCVVQEYIVLFLQSEMVLEWSRTSGKHDLFYWREETEKGVTLWSYNHKVSLGQLHSRRGWKAEGFWFSDRVIKIEIQPHVRVIQRVGRAVPEKGESPQVKSSSLLGSQHETIPHSPYAAAYPHARWVSEQGLLIGRLHSSLPKVRILPQDVRGAKVQSGQLGTAFVIDMLINFPEERVPTVFFWGGPQGLAWDVSLMDLGTFWGREIESWDTSGSTPGTLYDKRVMGLKRGSLKIAPLIQEDEGPWICSFCIPQSLEFKGPNRSCIMRRETVMIKVWVPTTPKVQLFTLPVTTREPNLQSCSTHHQVVKSGPFQLNQLRAIPVILEAQLHLITWQINLEEWVISNIYPNCSTAAATLVQALMSWARSTGDIVARRRSRDVADTILGGMGTGMGIANSVDIEGMTEVIQQLGTLGQQNVGTQHHLNMVLEQLMHNTYKVQGYTQRHIQTILKKMIAHGKGAAWEIACLSMQTELTADFKIMAQALSEGKTPLQLRLDHDFPLGGSFAWLHRDAWINKWIGCESSSCTATSLVPIDGSTQVVFPVVSLGTPVSSTHVLHHDLIGQHFAMFGGDMKQVDLSSCWQFLNKYMCLPGQVRFIDENCWHNNTECTAAIQKIRPDAKPIIPVAEGKVCFLNMMSTDTFVVHFHNCSDKVDLNMGTYCVSGDPIWIQSSRFDYVIPQIVKKTLRFKAPKEVPILRDNTPWDKWVQVLMQDHTLLKRLNKHNAKLEVIFHHDQGELTEVEHKYDQVSSSLTWWRRFLAMFQGHTDWASAVQNFCLHPLVVMMGITIICIITQSPRGRDRRSSLENESKQ